MSKLVLGTRGSALALWQANWVTATLAREYPQLIVERRIIKTEGDIHQDVPIASGDVGIFVRRIETALLEGEIDFAVHSLKDLPTEQPAPLTVAAIPVRHDPRDALLTVDGKTFGELRSGARIGTSSLRRRTQLLHARPDLEILPMRGNVDTRIRKLREGNFDALVLAVAGVERLGIREVQMQPLDASLCLPAVGQGALGIEIRREDAAAREVISVLDDPTTHTAVDVERAYLRELGGGCMAPATAYARVEGNRIVIDARVGSVDGRQLLIDRDEGAVGEACAIGRRLAQRMLAAGARELLLEARRNDGSKPE